MENTTNPESVPNLEPVTNPFAHINGWGVDADPNNEPTYPMKHWNGDDHKRLNYERPPQQEQTVEILKSIERPTLSAVFGTSVPPSGLSGAIRRFAFRFTESEYGHWLPLLLADRINVFEGLADDLRNDHIPNLFAEWGWPGDWKYDRKHLATKLAITAAVTTALFVYMRRKKMLRID